MTGPAPTDSSIPEAERLGRSECWARLRSVPVCRIALCAPDGPRILPMNHLVDHGTLVIRTADGTAFAAAATGALVAVEVDGYDEESGTAWSVVGRGRAHEITALHELIELEQLPLAPWHGGPKHRFLRIEPDVLTGRRFPVVDATVWAGVLSGARHVRPEQGRSRARSGPPRSA